MRDTSSMASRRFNRLIVVSRVSTTDKRNSAWLCRCDCGVETEVLRGNLTSGRTHSCGCLHKEASSLRTITHGHTVKRNGVFRATRTYNSWSSMIERCCCLQSKKFAAYGARGVQVCDRWRQSFTDFLADMGIRPTGTSLDRIDPFGNYEPTNCRWADGSTQRWNRRYPLDSLGRP